MLVLHLRIVDRALHRGLRLAEHRERLLGEQDVVKGLLHLGRQVDARGACGLHGRGHLRVVHLQRAVDRRREERQRQVALHGEGVIGSERNAAAHLGLHDRTGVAARRRNLRQQVAPRLALHVVVTLHLHLRDLDGRVFAQGEIQRLGKRQPHLRRSAGDARRPKGDDQKKSFHHYSVKLCCHYHLCGRTERTDISVPAPFAPAIASGERLWQARSVSGSRRRAAAPWSWRCRGKNC